jgi:HEAT repeat protein
MIRMRVCCFLGMAVLSVGLGIGNAACDEKMSNDVPALTKLLHDKDPQVRGRAVDRLGFLGKRAVPAMPDMIALLGDEETAEPYLVAPNRVGDFAQHALSRIGQPAVRPLMDALESPKENAREQAAAALAAMETPPTDALPALLKRLHDSGKGVRRNVARALGRIGKNAKRTIPEILDLAKNDVDEIVRYEAIAAAAMMDEDGKIAIPACIQALKDKSPYVRSSASASLGNYHAKAESAVAALILGLDDQGSHLVAVTPDMGLPRLVRDDVAEALGRIGRTAAPALPKLRKMLHSDNDEENVAIVAQAILRIDPNDKEALPTLIALVNNAEENGNGEEALAALEELGSAAADAVPAIKSALRNKTYTVRSQAAEALATIAGKDAVPVLIEQMKWEQRTGNERRSQEKAKPPSEREYWFDEDIEVCQSIATALGRLGSDAAPAVPTLAAFMGNAELSSKDDAIEALGAIGPAAKDAVPQLTKELDDADADTRKITVAALGRIGPAAKAALPRLRQLADRDPDENVREAAQAAVRRIAPESPRSGATQKP